LRQLLCTAWILTLTPTLGGCPGPHYNPKLANTHYLIGADYIRKKMPQAAKSELMQAVKLDPDNSDAHYLLGVIFFMEGMNKINLLERVQCLSGIAAQEQRQEANKEFRRCEKQLLEVVRLAERERKERSDALNYLANVSLHFKRYEESISRAKKALTNILYVPRHLSLGTLGWAYYQRGDLVGAARELRQSIFHEPRFCVGRYRLAQVYYDQKNYDKALEEVKQVTEDKACPIQEAHELMGLTLIKKKELEGARAAFDSCVKLNPKSCISEKCRRYAKRI